MTEITGVLEKTETRVERVKIWCKDHKGELLTAAGALVLVGVAAVIYKKQQDEIAGLSAENEELRNQPPQIENHNTQNNNVYNIEILERSTPSKPVMLTKIDGSRDFFNSLSEAARETGCDRVMISKQVNGHIPDVHGNVFELLERAA
jgi:hypothetical protein